MIFNETYQKSAYNGLYSITQLDDMILNQGYVPVATVDEFTNFRNSATQQMGAGTRWAGNYATGMDKKYVQLNNIDLTAFQSGIGWNPIGDIDNMFTGEYDGNYFKISNCVINNPTVGYQGLFGYISGAKIKNLEVSDFNITGKDSVGIVGYAASSSELSHITVKDGIVLSSASSAGGLVGKCFSGTLNWVTIDNVNVSTNSVKNGFGLGGLAGFLNSTSTIASFCSVKNSNVYSNLNVIVGDVRVGGFVGLANGARINNSYVINTEVFARGTDFGYPGVGGFVGRTVNGGPIFTNCYSNAKVERIGVILIGGFCGGLSRGAITNSYYDTDISGQSDTGKGLPRSTNQMKQGTADSTVDGEAMYTGWDANIWDFGDNNSYPILK